MEKGDGNVASALIQVVVGVFEQEFEINVESSSLMRALQFRIDCAIVLHRVGYICCGRKRFHHFFDFLRLPNYELVFTKSDNLSCS